MFGKDRIRKEKHITSHGSPFTADVVTGGRKLRVNVSPGVQVEELLIGQEVLLNEALNVVEALAFETVGDVVMVKGSNGSKASLVAAALANLGVTEQGNNPSGSGAPRATR